LISAANFFWQAFFLQIFQRRYSKYKESNVQHHSHLDVCGIVDRGC